MSSSDQTETRPPWWPKAEAKIHADAGCAHPAYCNVPAEQDEDPEGGA